MVVMFAVGGGIVWYRCCRLCYGSRLCGWGQQCCDCGVVVIGVIAGIGVKVALIWNGRYDCGSMRLWMLALSLLVLLWLCVLLQLVRYVC